MAFAPGDRVKRRERPGGPGLTGEIIAVRWVENPPYPAEWAYETSWGSSYPAHELIRITEAEES